MVTGQGSKVKVLGEELEDPGHEVGSLEDGSLAGIKKLFQHLQVLL